MLKFILHLQPVEQYALGLTVDVRAVNVTR